MVKLMKTREILEKKDRLSVNLSSSMSVKDGYLKGENFFGEK